ncbi:hypothetical protein D3C71_1079820 [compost metagenome]
MEDWRQCSCPETGQAVDSQWDLPGLKASGKQTYSALHRCWAVYLELGAHGKSKATVEQLGVVARIHHNHCLRLCRVLFRD